MSIAALSNPIIWIILVLALFCYTLTIEMIFFQEADEEWFDFVSTWRETFRILISCLPLLGLLGTIVGLLKTFYFMSNNEGYAVVELISHGMADALFTTQVGLLMVVPGWILYSVLAYKAHKWKTLQLVDSYSGGHHEKDA